MKYLLAGVALLVTLTSAHAFDWKHGRWEVTSETNNYDQPYCMLYTEYEQRNLAIAVTSGVIRVAMMKSDWSIPAGTYKDVAIWESAGETHGPYTVHADELGPVMYMEFGMNSLGPMLDELAKGLHLVIRFPKDRFHMPLDGSANATKALTNCIDQTLGSNPLEGSKHSPL